jgi:hypothetical protein
VEDKVVSEPVGEFALKGIQAPVPAFNIVSMRTAAIVVSREPDAIVVSS